MRCYGYGNLRTEGNSSANDLRDAEERAKRVEELHDHHCLPKHLQRKAANDRGSLWEGLYGEKTFIKPNPETRILRAALHVYIYIVTLLSVHRRSSRGLSHSFSLSFCRRFCSCISRSFLSRCSFLLSFSSPWPPLGADAPSV